MRFFTRELYRQCRSADEGVLDAACREWERANESYERHMDALLPRLPAHLRAFTELRLHDARVQSIARQGDRLLVVLHKDIPPRDLVLLSYDLQGEPILEPFADAPRDWSRPTDFQFDEFDVAEEGGQTVYTQEVVFGNGWLMRLRFRDVQVSLARPIYPVGDAGSLPSFSLPPPT
jgi:hypothetical protein